jgi:hypothetical protein
VDADRNHQLLIAEIRLKIASVSKIAEKKTKNITLKNLCIKQQEKYLLVSCKVDSMYYKLNLSLTMTAT